MANKKTKQMNRKLLADAKQYLVLVRNLITIQKALTMGKLEDISPAKKEFIIRTTELVKGTTVVSTKVLEAVDALKALPSSAPSYKRRGAVKELNDVLGDRAMDAHAIMSVILESAEYTDDDVDLPADVIESGLDSETKDNGVSDEA